MTAPTTAKVEAAVEAARAGKPGAADVLRQHMAYFHNLAVAVAPGSQDRPNPKSDPVRFERWSQLAIACAKSLLPFEEPKPAAAVPQIEFQAHVSVTNNVEIQHNKLDLSKLSGADLLRLYRMRIAAGPGVAVEFAPRDPPRPALPEQAPTVPAARTPLPMVSNAPVEPEEDDAEPAATVAVNNASNESSEPEPAPGSANVVRWPVWTSGTEARS